MEGEYVMGVYTLKNGVGALIKESQRPILPLPLYKVISNKAIYKPESGCHCTVNGPLTKWWTFEQITMGNKHLLCKLYNICGIVISSLDDIR